MGPLIPKAEFEQLVRDAVGAIPDDFLSIMHNVDVHVRRKPTIRQLRILQLERREMLLGLYEGIPLTKRTTDYGMVPPDIITLFQEPIEAVCDTREDLVAEIRRTVIHEVAHHFGITDVELDAWGVN